MPAQNVLPREPFLAIHWDGTKEDATEIDAALKARFGPEMDAGISVDVHGKPCLFVETSSRYFLLFPGDWAVVVSDSGDLEKDGRGWKWFIKYTSEDEVLKDYSFRAEIETIDVTVGLDVDAPPPFRMATSGSLLLPVMLGRYHG
jgi:hypothetical protein